MVCTHHVLMEPYLVGRDAVDADDKADAARILLVARVVQTLGHRVTLRVDLHLDPASGSADTRSPKVAAIRTPGNDR